jgi:pimeloyl-ACP methyl ester carboxylesterase
MSYYAHGNVNFHFEVEGVGFPILFFHGLGGDWTQSKTILEHVHGFSKIFMESRGHGSTHPLGPNENLNFHQFAEDAISLAQYLGHERFIAGGISMGSAIAIRIALKFPHCIEALILIRPAWLNKPKPENLKALMLAGELLQKYRLERAKSFIQESKEYTYLEEVAPAVANSLLCQFDEPNAKEYAIRLINIPASTPFDDEMDLEQIRAETMILATDQDPAHPLWMAEYLASKIHTARFDIVTSKSEDVEKHFEDITYHINEFLERFRISPSETTFR